MLLLAALSLPASAAEPGPIAARLGETLDQIDATPEQRGRIRDQLEAARTTLAGFREEAIALREEIHQALLGPSVDRATLEADREELVDLFDRATRYSFGLFADVAETLTPAQRAELHQLRDQRIADRLARWRGAAQ